MEKEISALNEIRSFIKSLKEKLNLKIQENNKLNEDILSAGQEITHLKTKISDLSGKKLILTNFLGGIKFFE